MDDIIHMLSILGVAMLRPLGAVLFLPPFNASMLGGTLIRNALILVSTLPILPLVAPVVVPDPVAAPVDFTLLIARELLIGVLIGFSAAIPFWAMDAAGFIIDTMRGASMAGVFNPLLANQSSPLGSLFSQLISVFFMIAGGFHVLLTALYRSCWLLPPGQVWQWKTGFIPLLSRQWDVTYNLALTFAMPAIVMMVLTDLGLGLINRSVQQLNVFTLSMPIKSLLALLMMIISLPFGIYEVLTHFAQFKGGLLLQLEPAL